MNLLAPLNLLWLLPAVGAIVALYMLRVKRRDVTVPSTMLWEQVLRDTHANAPFQKLKRNLLLVLQIAAAVACVLALARPFLWASGLGGRSTALVLDASASMRATDEPGGRFAAALVKAQQMVANKAAGDAVAVVLAADRPTMLCPLTTDRKRLEAALRAARPTDTVGDIREAISFAATLVGSRAGAQVTVLTDGAIGRPDAVALGGARLGFVTVGRRAENVAVTALDVRDTLGGGAGRQAFVTVQNFSPRARRVPLEMYVNGALADAHEIALGPGESRSEVFEGLRAADAGGLVRARLDAHDDLPADDEATVTLAPRRPLRLLLVSEGNPFFERALTTDARVVLDTVAPAKYRPEDSARYDATLWDDVAPPKTLPPGTRHLFWGDKCLGADAVPAVATKTGTPVADRPQILDWSRTHPLMRFVDLANVKLLRARNVAPAPWAQTLAEGENGPLVVVGERGDARAVYVAFNLLESDMPLRVAFPVFLTNCVQWLTARPGDTGGVTRPGEAVPLAAGPDAGALTVTRPDGTRDTLPAATPGAPPQYRRTTAAGVYRATGKNFEQSFAVSLLSAAESNIAPIARPILAVTDAPAENAKQTTAIRGVAVRREVWPYVVGLVLLVLCVEWWVYHRRV
jgi:hypothetical protein